MKKILVLMMTIVMVIGMTACGGSEPAPDSDAAEITVTMSIDFPDESGIADIEDAKVTVPGGASVYDVLKTYADANGIETLLEESGGIDCVTNIGGVVQTDSMGWVYEVNDEPVMDTATDLIANDGDVIDWETQEW